MNLVQPMKSIKAIVVGSLFVAVVFLVLQLAYVFIAVGYNMIAADFPFLKNISGIFRYLIGLPVLIIVMFIGGYITAAIANVHTKTKVWLHCFMVAIITAGGTMYSTLENYNLTLTGIIVIILSVSASSAGGFYWLRDIEINKSIL